MTRRGSIERCVRVFAWMKNQKNYVARSDIYNMMIRLHARHYQVDQARGLFFEMPKWRYWNWITYLFLCLILFVVLLFG